MPGLGYLSNTNCSIYTNKSLNSVNIIIQLIRSNYSNQATPDTILTL